MIKFANIRGLVFMGLACTALLAQAGGALAQENCEATIVITKPLLENGVADTENPTIDIEGMVINPCWVSDIAYENKSNGETGNAYNVTTNFANLEDNWSFKIRDVPLKPATGPGESEANEIEVTVSAANPSQTTFVVIHGLPADNMPPDGTLNPVNTPYTKAKWTWDLLADYDSVSTNARLIPLQPFKMPCGPGDKVILTFFAEGPDGPIELYREVIDSEDAAVCHDSKFRKTGPARELRDVLISPRSDGNLTFYVYGARLNWEPNPATDEFVRSVSKYTVVLQVAYADGTTLEWQIEEGPDLSFETVFNGKGDPVRNVVRYNR